MQIDVQMLNQDYTKSRSELFLDENKDSIGQ